MRTLSIEFSICISPALYIIHRFDKPVLCGFVYRLESATEILNIIWHQMITVQ